MGVEIEFNYTPYQVHKAQVLDRNLKLLDGLVKDQMGGGHILRVEEETESIDFKLTEIIGGIAEIVDSTIKDLSYDIKIDPVTKVRIRKVNTIGKELADDILFQNKNKYEGQGLA